MKKIYPILASLAMGVPQLLQAVPADPEPKTVIQPDGTELTVVITGDEHYNMLCTADGLPLYFNPQSRAWEYARLQQGRLTGSGIEAANAGMRSANARDYIKQMDVTAMERAVMSAPAKLHRAPTRSDFLISDYPTTGKQKTLVVLVQFADVKFSSMDDPLQFYKDMLNKEGFTYSNGANGSARDFYMASSNGQFDPSFDVVGPVTLSKECAFYGTDQPERDCNVPAFLEETLTQLDPTVDFSQYDLDNNGYIDNIYFFYAGNGQADSPITDVIWPHSAEAPDAWGLNLTLDGKIFSHYACSNEVRYSTVGNVEATGIGTFVHEFGHVLGLIDHYDVAYGMLTHHPYKWDTMASGAYNNNMHTPPLFSAFERAELGWLEYEKLPADYAHILNVERLDKSNKAWRIDVPGEENEFFVIENRQQEGWDYFLPGHGMLVWHIDQDAEIWSKNIANIDPAHQRIDIVEADGLADQNTFTGDAFPGNKGVTTFELKAWNGSTVATFDDVTEDEGEITLLLGGTAFEMPAPARILLPEVTEESFTFSYEAVPHAKYYIVDVTDAASGKAVGTFTAKKYFSVDEVKVESLEPEHKYKVSVKAGLGSYLSKAVEQEVTTTEIPFGKLAVAGLEASNIQKTGFEASWEPMSRAESYQLYLNRLNYSDDATAKGYDFKDKYDGMPTLWSSSSQQFYSVKDFYGEAAPSLRLSADDDYLSIEWPEAKITALKFWCRAKEEGQKLHLQVPDENEQWKDQQVIEVPTTGKIMEIEVPVTQRVRLLYERTGGFVVIDDVEASCYTLERKPVEGFNPADAGTATHLLLNNLAEGATYGWHVIAICDGVQSAPSEEYVLKLPGVETGVSTPVVITAPEGIYDLLGRRYQSREGLASGVYIINGIKQIVK